MNKVWGSPEDALADLQDGASIAVSGFGTSYGFACSLLVAARDKGVRNLTLVSNGLGAVGQLRGMLLVASGQVSKLIVSFSSRPGMRTPADDLIESGDIEVELVPQGILVERMRAAGAGIPAFYSPVGIGTSIAEGREVLSGFGDREPLLVLRQFRSRCHGPPVTPRASSWDGRSRSAPTPPSTRAGG